MPGFQERYTVHRFVGEFARPIGKRHIGQHQDISLRLESVAIVRKLPPDLRQEVEDFARFLLSCEKRKGGDTLRQDWAGGLASLKGLYTSMELQK